MAEHDFAALHQEIERLKAVETELRDFIDNATEPLHWVGADGRILWANQAELDLLGYSRDEYIGHNIAEFHADPAAIADILQRLSNNEELRGYDARLRAKDGSIKHVLINSNVFWQDGKFVHTRCFTRDITERVKATDALRQWQHIFLHAGWPVAIIEPDTNTLRDVNHAFARMHGYNVDELKGRWCGETFAPESRGDLPEYAKKVYEHGDYIYESMHIRKDGTRFPVLTHGSAFRDGEGRVLFRAATFQDLTEINQMHDALERAERTARFLAKASASLAELSDLRTTLQKVASLAVPDFADWCVVDMVQANAQIERLAVAHREPEKSSLPPSVDDPDGIASVIRTGQSLLLETSAKGSCIAVPLISHGNVLGVVTFVMAESDRHYDRDDLAAAEDLARRTVVAIDNAQMYNELRETDRRKTEFLATLAHELRNPLAPISNSLQIMRFSPNDLAAARSAHEVIDRQLKHMVRLVDDLLDLARVSRGKIELRKERVDLAVTLENAIETSQPLIEGSRHELVVDCPRGEIFIQADPVRIAQIVANLLNNAAKYTPAGGRIWLTGRTKGSMAEICVRDTGVGISKEMLPRVFNMFAQVNSSLEHSQGGLGIGLTLVQSLVQMHGGTIRATSGGDGKGSEFQVRIPLAGEGKAAQEPETDVSKSAPEPSPTTRILVVDDNVDAAESLAMLLKIKGNETRMAHDGPTAIETAKTFNPEVMLLDIGLPGMSGYDVARAIRTMPEGKDILLIALTGWGQEEDRRRCEEAGFDHHLTKPADPANIDKLLDAWRSSSRPRRAG